MVQKVSIVGIAAACAAHLPFEATGSAATGGPGLGSTVERLKDGDLKSEARGVASALHVHPAGFIKPPADGGPTVSAALSPGAKLDAKVIEIPSEVQLMATVTGHDGVYIHVRSDRTWYFKSADYLLGIEVFTQYDKRLGGVWVDLGSGDATGPAQARVVGHNLRGHGWKIPSIADHGRWPASINSAWVIGTQTDTGKFGMGGAPQGIPLGTEVFGSMQTYGGVASTVSLEGDKSPAADARRIRELFSFNAATLLGGHSAGSSVARQIALELGLVHVWLYGTPNYVRKTGTYTETETGPTHRKMVAEVINNNNDPVTSCLRNPLTLVSLAWGTQACHDYSGWNYETRSPVHTVCQ
jgi:hypothetical protein